MQTDDSQDGVKIAFNHSKTNCIAKIHCTNKVMKPKLHVEVNTHMQYPQVIEHAHPTLQKNNPFPAKESVHPLQFSQSVHCPKDGACIG